MAPPRRTVSNRQADIAGDEFRWWAALPDDDSDEPGALARLIQAMQTIQVYREMHAYPMVRVTVGVRSMVRTATRDDSLRPGQRFKRRNRILVKLLRRPTMRLSQMEDIGGCRVVLPTLDALYAVSNRIMRQWRDTARLTDYVAQPKDDGYRGIHIVERRDGRLIEVQLRTEGQHAWAQAIEDYSPVTGYELKDGFGPADLRRYFKMAADRIACDERGEPPDAVLEERFARLRVQVRPYFERRA